MRCRFTFLQQAKERADDEADRDTMWCIVQGWPRITNSDGMAKEFLLTGRWLTADK